MPSQTSSKKNKTARTPQLDRGKARVAALLNAAAETFADAGYDAATMTQIAAAAGASIGSLYQYFPTKALLADVLQTELVILLGAELEAIATQCSGLPVSKIAASLFQRIQVFVTTHPAFIALADRRDVDKERKRQSRTQLLALLTTILGNAEPAPAPARRDNLAIILLEMMKLVVSLSAAENRRSAEAVIREVEAMLGSYLDQPVAGMDEGNG